MGQALAVPDLLIAELLPDVEGAALAALSRQEPLPEEDQEQEDADG